MKELKRGPGWDWNAWFWLDRVEFDGGWQEGHTQKGQIRYRTEKAVGRDTDGRLFLMHWVNHDRFDWHKFTQTFYEITPEEYENFLDRAIERGEVAAEERRRLLDRAKEPFRPPWDGRKNTAVYQDGRYVLGQKDGKPLFTVDGRTYELACHPYEPCTFLKKDGELVVSIHNAFEPFSVLESFAKGGTVKSITGKVYGPKEFCDMLAWAAENCFDTDVSFVEGAMAVERMKALGATGPERAVELSALGVRSISDQFSHSRKLTERVMYTEDGKVWVRIKE